MSHTVSNIVLVGNPNCGKTTLFNALSGLKQKISNLPGTTVDKKETQIQIQNQTYRLIDLPGVYSLTRTETEQAMVLEQLQKLNKENTVILCVADESNLRRNLLLVQQTLQLGFRTALLLNMHDIAKRRNIQIDTDKLEKLLQIPVASIVAAKRTGFDNLNNIIANARTSNWGHNAQQNIESKYKIIEEIVTQVQNKKPSFTKSFTTKLDAIATHKILGFVLLFVVLAVVFQAVFTLAAFPMQWIETAIESLTQFIEPNISNNTLQSLICQGLLPGIAGILVFIPQIALLFLLIGLLEDSGYLTRVSYISDYPFRKIGLNGRSVIPLLGGFACAIPGIMSTRTISNKFERLLTMFIVPLMPCSARLPVYILIIGLCIPNIELWGLVNLQGLVMTALYFSGVAMASLVALFARLLIKNRQASEFILELPSYQIPKLRNLWNSVYERCRSFVVEAGKIILIISIVLWFAANYGPNKAQQAAERTLITTVQQDKLNKQETNILKAKLKLESSYLGHVGKFIEPAISPLGFDWKTGIAILSSFAAREVFVGTMSTIFSIENSDNLGSLRLKMANSTNEARPSGKYDLAYGVSMLLFYAFAMQCASTLSIMYKESKSWKLTMLQLVLYSGLAYMLAWLAQLLLG